MSLLQNKSASVDVSESVCNNTFGPDSCLDSVVRYRVYDAYGGKHHADVDDWPGGPTGGNWG